MRALSLASSGPARRKARAEQHRVALDYVSPHREAPLPLIAVFTMLMPALFALAQLVLPPATEAKADTQQ